MEDITQATFILAFQKFHQFRGGSFRARLLKMATKLCYDEMRTWKRNTFQVLEPINKEGEVNESPQWIKDPRPHPQEEVEANDLSEILENTLNELPCIYRIPLSLIDIQELDYDELIILQRHPTYAYELFCPIPCLLPVLDIPYCHHEKWDGTGYPRELKGNQIPFSARLFALVDVWDALLSDRPYRSAWPMDQANEYIFEQIGKHYDPEITTVFLEKITLMIRNRERNFH